MALSADGGLAATPGPVLSAQRLSKRFGGIDALDDVSLDLFPGEIHGVCGENGAGKSTFIKILGGLIRPSKGRIVIGGETLNLGKRTDPRLISIVHQELAIVPTLSVIDNILLGGSDSGEIYLRNRFRSVVRRQLDVIGLSHVGLDTLASKLGLAERQLVEIARGVMRRAKVLLLDEPTATLSDAEIQRVFATVRLLRDQGAAIVFVSHRLDEVFAITDRVTVFRNGRRVLTERTSDLTANALVRAMIGRELTQRPARAVPRLQREPRLAISRFSIPGALNRIDLSVAAGEIVAIVGQLGSGADVLVEALGGLRGRIAGVRLDGEPIMIGSVRSAMKAGIGYVPEDRAGKGVFLNAPVDVNLTASVMARFSSFGIMRHPRERARALELARMFQIDAKRLGSEA
jgi:ribose transport system ATP-binding protein